MTDLQTLKGLNCPRCGGTVSIPEGQAIVQCPYCDLRAVVQGERGAGEASDRRSAPHFSHAPSERGAGEASDGRSAERGVRRYQVPCRVDRAAAQGKLNGFLGSNLAIAFNAKGQAQLNESFLVWLPFRATWSRVLGWVFGKEKVGSGKNSRWEPREKKIAKDMVWNGAACDVGEFGVQRVPLQHNPSELEPFDAEALRASGMVFEPVNSVAEAQAAAEAEFAQRVQNEAGIDRVSQTFTRYVNERFGVVYYPLWVLRYLYRGRAYQVVVDGHSGDVLYGKAPGNTLYRAGVLVGGMALGAFLGVDVSLGIMGAGIGTNSDDGDGPFIFALLVAAVGFGMMFFAYRAFRYGEVYEYQRDKPNRVTGSTVTEMLPVPEAVKRLLR
jgi:DNA-directed RNA polymerase subunit RPC12/RpoP